MANFRVGQKVVCVNASGLGPSVGFGDEIMPKEGEMYTIREIGITLLGRPGCLLEEIVNQARRYDDDMPERVEPMFLVYRFRPVRITNIDVFLKLLEPTHSDGPMTEPREPAIATVT